MSHSVVVMFKGGEVLHYHTKILINLNQLLCLLTFDYFRKQNLLFLSIERNECAVLIQHITYIPSIYVTGIVLGS